MSKQESKWNKFLVKAFGRNFQVDEQALQDFVIWNEKQWEKVGKAENGYCFINFNMINKEMSLMIPKILYAKGIEERLGLKPIILDWGMTDELIRIYDSFQLDYVNVHQKMAYNVSGIIKSAWIAAKCRITKMSGEELQKLTFNGTKIGNNIYSDILRSSNLSTIRCVDNSICLRKIFTMLLFADTVNKIVNKKNPVVCVSDDWPYNEGIVLEIMNKKEAFISQISLRRENTLTTAKGEFDRYRHSELHTQVKNFLDNPKNEINQEVVDTYLDNRFSGKNSSFRDKVAFLGKKTLSREEWNLSMGLDPNKKNVVVMCHTFSDAVFNSEYTAFRDYYDWTEKTLQLISKMDHVNWIVKPHPARADYNEAVDSIEKMFEKYKTEHVHFFPDDVSTASLKEVADVLVTICGTAGTEFPCFGIPVITCGKAFYTGFGYTKTPNTLEEYKEMLMNIDHMGRLSEEQIQTSRKVLYAYISCFDTDFDELDKMLYDMLRKYQNQPVEAGMEKEALKEYNSLVIEKVMPYIDQQGWKNTAFYQRGYALKDRMN